MSASLSISELVSAPTTVYVAQCAIYKVRPNAAVLALLGGGTGSGATGSSAASAVAPFSITCLDMRCTFLGAQGCKALLGFVQMHASIQTLNLTKSGMDSDALTLLSQIIIHHPALRTIVLDHNIVSIPCARALWDAIRGCRLGSAIESISLRGCGLQEEWETRIERSLEVHRTFQRDGFYSHGHLRPTHEWRSVYIGILCDTTERCRSTADVVIPFLQTLVNPLKLRVAPVAIAVDSAEVSGFSSRHRLNTIPEVTLRKLQLCRDEANEGLPWVIVALDAGDDAPLGSLVSTLIPAVLSWFEHAQPPALKDRLGRPRPKIYRTPAPAAVFTINSNPQNRRVAEQLMSEETIAALNHKDDLFGALAHTGTLHKCGNDADFVVSCVTWLFGALSAVYDAPPLAAIEVTRRQLLVENGARGAPGNNSSYCSYCAGDAPFDTQVERMVLTGVDAVAGVLLSKDATALAATRQAVINVGTEESLQLTNNETISGSGSGAVAILARHGLVKSQSCSRPNSALNPAPPAASAPYKSSNRRYSTGSPLLTAAAAAPVGHLHQQLVAAPTGLVDVPDCKFHKIFLAAEKFSATPLVGTRPYQLLEERMSDVVADWCDIGREHHPSDVQDVTAYCIREASGCSFPYVLYGGSGCGKKHILSGATASIVDHNQSLLQTAMCHMNDGIVSSDTVQPARVPIPYFVGIAPNGITYMIDYLLFALETIRTATVSPSELEVLASKRPIPTDLSYSSVQLLMAKLADELANYPSDAPPIVILISNIQDLQVPCGRPSWSTQTGSAASATPTNFLTSATPEESLRWLPAVLPAHVRVVVSVDTASPLLPRLRGRVPQPYERLASNAPQIVTATALGQALRRKNLYVPGLASSPSSGQPPRTAPSNHRNDGIDPGGAVYDGEYDNVGDWVECNDATAIDAFDEDSTIGDVPHHQQTHIPRPPKRSGGVGNQINSTPASNYGSRPATVPAHQQQQRDIATNFTTPTYHGPGSITGPVLNDAVVSSETVSAAHALVTKEEAHCFLFPTLAVSFLEMAGAATTVENIPSTTTGSGDHYHSSSGSPCASQVSDVNSNIQHHNPLSSSSGLDVPTLRWDTPESLRLLIRDSMADTVSELSEQLLSMLEGVLVPAATNQRRQQQVNAISSSLQTPPATASAAGVKRRASSIVALGLPKMVQSAGNPPPDEDEDGLFQPYFKSRNQSVVIAPLSGGGTLDDDSDEEDGNNATRKGGDLVDISAAETLRDVALCLAVCPLSASELIGVVEDAMGNPKDSTMSMLQWLVNLGLVHLNYNANYQLAGSQVRDGVIRFYGAASGMGEGIPQEPHQCAIAAFYHSVVLAGGLSMVDVLPSLLTLWLTVGEYSRVADLLTNPEILEELIQRDAPAARSAIVQGYLHLIALLENLEEAGSSLDKDVAESSGVGAAYNELVRAAQSLSSEPQCGLHTTRMSRVLRRILRDFTSLSSTSIVQMCFTLPEDSVLYRRAIKACSLPHPVAIPVAGKQTESSSAHTIQLVSSLPIRHTSCDPLTKILVCATTSQSVTVIDSSDGREVAHLKSWLERINTPTSFSQTSTHRSVEFISAFFVPFHLATATGLTVIDRLVVVVCADRVLIWSVTFNNTAPYTSLLTSTTTSTITSSEKGGVGKIVGVATNYTASGSRRIMNDEGTLLIMRHITDGHVALLDISSRKVLSSFLPAYRSNNNDGSGSGSPSSSSPSSPTMGATKQGMYQGAADQDYHEARPADVREAVFAGGNVVIVSGYDCFVYSATRIQMMPAGSHQHSIDVPLTASGSMSTSATSYGSSAIPQSSNQITLSRVVRGGVAPQVLLHPGSITAMCVSADGRFLATAVGSSSFIWDIVSGAQLHVCEDTERSSFIQSRCVPEIADNTVRCLSFHPSGATLIVGIADGSVVIFSTISGCVATKMHVTSGLPRQLYEDPATLHRLSRLGCSGCMYSDDAQRIICRFGPILRIFDSITFDDRGVVVAHGGTDITTVCAVPQGPILTSNGTGEVKLFAPSRQLPTLLMALTEVPHSEGVTRGGRLIQHQPTLTSLSTAAVPCGILQAHLGTKDGTFVEEPDKVMVVLSARSNGSTELGAYLWEGEDVAITGGSGKARKLSIHQHIPTPQNVTISSAAGVALVAPETMAGMDDYSLVEYILEHGLPAVRRIPHRRLRVLLRSSAVDAVLGGHDMDAADDEGGRGRSSSPIDSPSGTSVVREAVYDHCVVHSRMSTVANPTTAGAKKKPKRTHATSATDDDFGQVPLPLSTNDESSITRYKRQLKLRRLLDEAQRGSLTADGGSDSGSRCRLLTQTEKLAHKIWACDSAVSSFALVSIPGHNNSIIFTIADHCLVGISAANGAPLLSEPLPRDIDAGSEWTIAYDEVVQRMVCVGTPHISKSTRILVYTATPNLTTTTGATSPYLQLSLVAHFQGHKGVCYATVMPPRYKGDAVVSVGSDRTVRLWTVTGHAERTSYTHDCAITSAVVTGPNTISMFDENMRSTVVSIGARAQTLQIGTPTPILIPHIRCVEPYRPAVTRSGGSHSKRTSGGGGGDTDSQIMSASAVPNSDGLIVLATAFSQLLLYDSKTDKVVSQLSVEGRWPVSTPELSLGSLVQSVSCQLLPHTTTAAATTTTNMSVILTASTRGGEVLVYRLVM